MNKTDFKTYLESIDKEDKNKVSYASVIISLVIMCSGFYMLLNKIVINSGFGFSRSLYHYSGVSITGGMILIPLIIGISWVFYNYKSMIAWLILSSSLASLIFGVISTARIRLSPMTTFDFIVISVLAFGGLGMLLKNLKKG